MCMFCHLFVMSVYVACVHLRSHYDTTVWEVSDSGPGCQSEYRSGDL